MEGELGGILVVDVCGELPDIIEVMQKVVLIFIMLLGVAPGLCADTILMKDGTMRRGTIESRSEEELRLRIDQGGIRATINLAMRDVVAIQTEVPRVKVEVAETGPAVVAETQAGAQGAEVARRRAVFFEEMLRTAVGNGRDDPTRLPGPVRELWEKVLDADVSNDLPGLMGAMGRLEESSRKDGELIYALNAMTRSRREMEFGRWMAETRWALIAGKYRSGQFDLRDVRELEKKGLIGILRVETEGALAPLRGYFPPVKEGNAVAFHPGQLAGITVGNALEVKEKALYASAVLIGQLKLEPRMPNVDRVLLTGQLISVRRMLARALELEPQARMALQRQEQERRRAEARAKQEAERQRNASGPR